VACRLLQGLCGSTTGPCGLSRGAVCVLSSGLQTGWSQIKAACVAASDRFSSCLPSQFKAARSAALHRFSSGFPSQSKAAFVVAPEWLPEPDCARQQHQQQQHQQHVLTLRTYLSSGFPSQSKAACVAALEWQHQQQQHQQHVLPLRKYSFKWLPEPDCGCMCGRTGPIFKCSRDLSCQLALTLRLQRCIFVARQNHVRGCLVMLFPMCLVHA
jgi:hypothetical protein